MLKTLLSGALVAVALATHAAATAANAPGGPLDAYRNHVAEVEEHVSAAAACYRAYVKRVEAADFAGTALLDSIKACDDEYDAGRARLRDGRAAEAEAGFPAERLLALELPDVLRARPDHAGAWNRRLEESLERLKALAAQAVETFDEEACSCLVPLTRHSRQLTCSSRPRGRR